MIFKNIISNLNKVLLQLNNTSSKLKADIDTNLLKSSSTNISNNTVNFGDEVNFSSINSESLLKKWVYSTNHKYIGILYLIFGLLMGIVGATFSLMIRLELLSPGHIFF